VFGCRRIVFYDMLLQMNYEHLKRCTESAPVPSMSQHLHDNIVKLIPSQLSVNYADVLKNLQDEVTVEFENTMRKSRGSCHYSCNLQIGDTLCSMLVLDNAVPGFEEKDD